MSCPFSNKKSDDCSSTGACPFKPKREDNGIPLDKDTGTCPNSDPVFDKLLSNLKLSNGTPEERSRLFIVCVITRALLYSGVYFYRDVSWMPYVVALASGASAIQLSRPSENKQWWSKKFQLVMAILVLMSAIAVKFAGLDSRSMAVLLFISLAGGIYQRTQVELC